MKLRCKIYCIDHGEFICDAMFEHDTPLLSMKKLFQSHEGHSIFIFFATYPKGVNLTNELQCWKCLQLFPSIQNKDFHQFYCNGVRKTQ